MDTVIDLGAAAGGASGEDVPTMPDWGLDQRQSCRVPLVYVA